MPGITLEQYYEKHKPKGGRKLFRVGIEVTLSSRMTDLIIATFTQESHAIEASKKMLELESNGEISIFELVIIKKDRTAIQKS